jgi:hypothetical protein
VNFSNFKVEEIARFNIKLVDQLRRFSIKLLNNNINMESKEFINEYAYFNYIFNFSLYVGVDNIQEYITTLITKLEGSPEQLNADYYNRYKEINSRIEGMTNYLYENLDNLKICIDQLGEHKNFDTKTEEGLKAAVEFYARQAFIKQVFKNILRKEDEDGHGNLSLEGIQNLKNMLNGSEHNIFTKCIFSTSLVQKIARDPIQNNQFISYQNNLNSIDEQIKHGLEQIEDERFKNSEHYEGAKAQLENLKKGIEKLKGYNSIIEHAMTTCRSSTDIHDEYRAEIIIDRYHENLGILNEALYPVQSTISQVLSESSESERRE